VHTEHGFPPQKKNEKIDLAGVYTMGALKSQGKILH
jgi:hypothetical protein